MSSNERESPRAAIRSWLHDAETKSPRPRQIRPNVQREQRQHDRKAKQYSTHHGPKTKGIELQRAAPPKTQDADRREDQSPRHYRDNMEDSEHGPARGKTSKSNEARTHRHTKARTVQRPDGPGLAEKLGLHAPFRTFRDRSEDEDMNLDPLSRPRKRRRRRSSTESYLEPAEIREQTDLESDADLPMKKGECGNSGRIYPESHSEHVLESPATMSKLPEKPAASYMRRPRHKTRDDHYQLKEGTNEGKKKKIKSSEHEGKDRKCKKHKRKAKLGAAIMDDFSAQNVSHDRLTLQSSKSLGLFGKGRASSPIRRRGLPDLAFSEMSFLNSRQRKPTEIAKPVDTRPAQKCKTRKSTQPADTEAEISRYFTSTKVPDKHPSDRPDGPKQRESNRRTRTRDSPSDFVDLPGTPFLGFGSCGAVSTSPTKKLGSPAVRDLERRLTRSPTRSTSYFSWSQSGAPSQGSTQLNKHNLSPMEPSRCLNPVSLEADPSRQALPTSHVEQILLEKHRTGTSVTSVRNARSRPGQCQGHSPLPKAKCSGKIEQRSQDREIKETVQASGLNTLGSVEGTSERAQTHTSPDLHRGNLASPSIDGMLAHRAESDAEAIGLPRPSDMVIDTAMNPLDTALEALLHDARTMDRKVEMIATGMTDFLPNHTKDVEITPADQTRHTPRTASNHGALPPIIAAGPHTKCDIPHLQSDHGIEVSKDQRSMQLTSGPSSHSSKRPQWGDDTRELLLSPYSRKVDSRSAWNGYGDIYERQQLGTPIAIDHDQYSAMHNSMNDGEYRKPDDSLPPSRQDSSRYLDDRTDSAFYERHGMSPPANSRLQEEAYLNEDGWGDAEENIIAEHGTSYPAELLAHGYEERYQGYNTFSDPQYRHDPATVIRRPTLLSFTPAIEETAPSRFWTPHKLY